MKQKLSAIFSILIFLTLVACEEEIPINEFSKTRLAIDKAKSVRADYYSPKEYKAAESGLMKAHEVLISEEEPEDSVKKSDEAYGNAIEAYNKSVILFSKDALQKADKAVQSADMAYAEKLSPVLFTQARDLYLAANDKYENKKYEESVVLAEESYAKALKAKDQSIDNKYELQVKIDSVYSTLKKVKSYNYNKYASNQYILAESSLKTAEQSYSVDAVKQGFSEVEVAKVNADAAYKAVMEGETSERISEAEKNVKLAESGNGAKIAEEDLAAAKEALENSKKLKSQGSYAESMTYANEALRLSNSVIEDGKKQAIVAANLKSSQKTKNKVKSSKSKYFYYKVKARSKYKDCLWLIAKKYYKNPRLWKKIHIANKGRIKNPDFIKPGWIIRVPKLKK